MRQPADIRTLFLQERITKDDIARYYERIAPVMLVHVKNRPLVLQSFPDDVAKRDVAHAPIDGVQALMDVAKLGYVTPYMWLSRTPRLRYPDVMVFDLDPVDDDFGVVREMAIALRDLLHQLGLASFPMVTGSRGLHVSIPLDRSSDFETVREFARDVAHGLADAYPEIATGSRRMGPRNRRLFIDVMRNAYSQTAVAPYSIRALPGLPVAVPLNWSELTGSHASPRRYNLRNIFRRLEALGDPWKSIWKHPQSLVRPRRILDQWIPSSEWRAA